MKSGSDTSPARVVLVHGFFRRGGNMRYIARALTRMGYVTFAPTLPTTFGNVRDCSESLAAFLERQGKNFAAGSAVHFVGHSMGGLVIRDYLSRRMVTGLGRVVLIGTPNGGSPYANLLLKLPFTRRIFKALPDLASPGPDIGQPLNDPAPEFGIIIGTRPDPVRQALLPGEHDGLVQAESVRRLTVSAELTVSCPHERIHWKPGTAEAVASFLETGKF